MHTFWPYHLLSASARPDGTLSTVSQEVRFAAIYVGQCRLL